MKVIVAVSTLFFVSSAPIYTPNRLQGGCLATCGSNLPITITKENARNVANDCFSKSGLTKVRDLAPLLHLTSNSNACTDEIYSLVDSVIQYDLSDEIVCQSVCNGNSNRKTSLYDAVECFSYISPPLIQMDDQEMHKLFSDAFQIVGQCHYKQFNEREQAIQATIKGSMELTRI